MIFVVGGEGFVGSAFCRYFEKQKLSYQSINRKNYSLFKGQRCSSLILAHGNSVKWLAEQDPEQDYERSVKAIHQAMLDFKSDQTILISSGDVYNDVSNPKKNSENAPIQASALSRYGFNKHQAEEIVKTHAKKWLVLRLGGMVGPGLKKNPIYDMIYAKPLHVSLDSRLQYIHTDQVALMAWELIHQQHFYEIFNISGHGIVCLQDVYEWTGKKTETKKDSPLVHFEINIDKISKFFKIPESQLTVKKFVKENMR